MIYSYLKAQTDTHHSVTEDANKKTVYELKADQAFETKPHGLNGNPETYEVTQSGVTGTAVLTLKLSLDGITWTTAKDDADADVTLSITSGTVNEIVKDENPIGALHKWVCDGSATAGVIKIKKLGR